VVSIGWYDELISFWFLNQFYSRLPIGSLP
jgi:hypothetical protein